MRTLHKPCYYTMILRLPLLLLFISVAFLSTAQEQVVSLATPLTDNCKSLLDKKLDFLIDGSFQDESSLKKEIARLKECGLDDFDVKFFARMESMSAMLRKMTQKKELEQMSFEDLFTEIEKIKATSGFIQVKKITFLSETLATRKGNLKNWNEDVKFFQELGASKNVISQVFEYLETHPENKKSYQDILESLKK
ncbi:MAG: hypothetical protein ACI9IZ_000798 [Nonlabens sp.]|jgi:hypothetical protein